MLTWVYSLLFAVVLIVKPGEIFGCTCAPESKNLKDAFCKPEFVITAKVLEGPLPYPSEKNPTTYYYNIADRNVFYASPNAESALSNEKIFTDDIHMCGASLEAGQYYFLHGRVNSENRAYDSTMKEIILTNF